MKRGILTIFKVVLTICIISTGCKEKEAKIKYELGIFPDSVFVLTGINSEYDDYNISIADPYVLTTGSPVIFSSNRKTSGGTFDYVYGTIEYTFNRVSGEFDLKSYMFENDFYETLTTKFNTSGNDFGPNRLFCSLDGFEYMFGASDFSGTGLDIKFSRYTPYISSTPLIPDPTLADAFNSTYNDAYICFNREFDTAYFCSDRGSDFDIYRLVRPSGVTFQNWLTSTGNSPLQVQGVQSGANEKCPFVSGKIMVFTSDRDGGFGGWDLYYSVLTAGEWGPPVNMGSGINTQYDEYRPVIGTDNTFENKFLVFSSNRPGGKGGFDLYLGPLIIE
jgi:hypothetical protein